MAGLNDLQGVQPELKRALTSFGDVAVPVGTPINGVKAELETDLAGDNNDLKFTAKTAGVLGNNITVEYVDPGENDATLSVELVGTDIIVNLATGAGGDITTTASEIETALEDDDDIDALITVADKDGSNGSGVVTELEKTELENGVDGTVADKGAVAVDTTNIYICPQGATITDTDNWKKVAHESL